MADSKGFDDLVDALKRAETSKMTDDQARLDKIGKRLGDAIVNNIIDATACGLALPECLRIMGAAVGLLIKHNRQNPVLGAVAATMICDDILRLATEPLEPDEAVGGKDPS